MRFWANTVNTVRGLEFPSRVEITLDGARVKLVTIGGQEDANLGNTNPTASAEQLSKRVELQIPVKAGPHTVTIAFLQKSTGPTVDMLEPFGREKLDPVNTAGIPEIDFLSISGPFNQTGPGDTPSRRAIFTCRPARQRRRQCPARAKFSRRWRAKPIAVPSPTPRPSACSPFTSAGATTAAFRCRHRNRAGLHSRQPAISVPFGNRPARYRSRHCLSHQRSGTGLAPVVFPVEQHPRRPTADPRGQGKLQDPAVLEQQVRRMLADKRADALTSNFLGQWLYLRNLKAAAPDQQIFPDFDDNLRQAFQHETELFFGSIMREDRSVVDLLNADYTFVNERLARHYGIPNVYGDQFRKVTIPNPARRGLLGQGSILTVTSYANRTSPVLRGKWVLTNIMGTPPPPPPPIVPPFKETASGTVRQRMEQHRANAACAACHKVMDPIGFSLENFDAIGAWRTTDTGGAVDASGVLADGTHD